MRLDLTAGDAGWTQCGCRPWSCHHEFLLRKGNHVNRSASASCRSTSGPDGAVGRCTTGFQNTHGTVCREVLYPWHPWFGRLVAVHAVVEKVAGTVCHCTLTDVVSSRWVELPLWMFDRASCPADTRISERSHVDVAALYALRDLLDHVRQQLRSAAEFSGVFRFSRDASGGGTDDSTHNR